MLNPGVYRVSAEEMDRIEAEELDGALVAEFDGASIETLKNYLYIAWKAFGLPKDWELIGVPYEEWNPNYGAYDDWMKDLDWLDDGVPIAVVIRNCGMFMRHEPRWRDIVIGDFQDLYIPGWAEGRGSFWLSCLDPEEKHDIALFLVD